MAYTVREPEEKLRIVFEGIKAENISELCRREGIWGSRRNGEKNNDPSG